VKGKRILKDVKLKPHTEHDLSVVRILAVDRVLFSWVIFSCHLLV